jgi:hypothetical protein
MTVRTERAEIHFGGQQAPFAKRLVGQAAGFGEPGWDRTIDLLIKSQPLYH